MADKCAICNRPRLSKRWPIYTPEGPWCHACLNSWLRGALYDAPLEKQEAWARKRKARCRRG